MKDLHLRLLALILTVVGVSLFLYKVFLLGFPLVPESQSPLWDLEAHIRFLASNQPVKISFFIPTQSRHFATVREHFISRGFGIATKEKGDNRRAVWSIRKAKGEQSLYYRALVRPVAEKRIRLRSPPPEQEGPVFEGAQLEAAKGLLAEIKEKSADVEGLVAELAKRLTRSAYDDNIGLLLGEEDSDARKAALAAQLLAQAGIAAREVHGIRLQARRSNVPLEHWIEILDGKEWRSFDMITGEEGIPDEYLAWWRGKSPLIRAEGVDDIRVTLSVALGQEEAIKTAIAGGKIKQPLLLDFSLFSLPVGAQAVYRVLLLLPVGALLLVVMRNVVGVKTFGTFMPILIAMAFRETKLLWGLIMFSLLVFLGLSVRLYFERLKLLVVPRLASVLVVVVLLMAGLSVLSHKLGLEKGISVAIFPMVILTMTIERMSILWEELGPAEALKQGLGSLLVAAAAYLVMRIAYVEHLVFVFPELALLVLAATLLLGRYSGYRLLELMRFRALFEKRDDA
jgi:hypothetical protein